MGPAGAARRVPELATLIGDNWACPSTVSKGRTCTSRGPPRPARGWGFKSGQTALQLTGCQRCRKTTLLRTACGLAYPDGGEITWCGENILEAAFHALLTWGTSHRSKRADRARDPPRPPRGRTTDSSGRSSIARWSASAANTPLAGQKRRAALAGLTLMRVPLWFSPTRRVSRRRGPGLVGALIDEHLQAGRSRGRGGPS